MKSTVWLPSLCAMVLLVSNVHAETAISVPYATARIYWDAPVDPPVGGAGATRWYIINCGAADIRIDAPATSIAVKDVVPTPGQYACTLWAENSFSRSAPAQAPLFEAGAAPAAPINLRIDAQ